MDGNIKYLKWDSDFFEKKVGRIDFKKNDDVKMLLDDAKNADYQLIYILGGNDFYIDDGILKKFNGHLADRKILYQKEIKNIKEPLPFVSEYKDKKTTPELVQLAFESGKYSRFKLDKNFREDDFYRMYKIWIENSVNHQIADNVFVAMENNQIKGMVTLKINNDNGHIGLIAISPDTQGKGYGKALITACEKELFNKNISKLEAPTQSGNKQACMFYKKCGFKIHSVTNIYHFWL
jgi:dTDP-4-amino-4,6-dideoxy-D-galactose acyltransferase